MNFNDCVARRAEIETERAGNSFNARKHTDCTQNKITWDKAKIAAFYATHEYKKKSIEWLA